MNPIGIAMAFLVLWMMIGLGIFLITTAAVRLTRGTARMGAVAQVAMAGQTKVMTETIINVVMLVAGLGLAFVGGNGVYTVIYR
ncbi:MAG: hypothetical protein M0T85_12875 [Dehalococcoidales bacterium]|nr:hypothetical protein [Dehalococcoidales bacterium]